MGRSSRKLRSLAAVIGLLAIGLALSACGRQFQFDHRRESAKGTYTITVSGQDSATADHHRDKPRLPSPSTNSANRRLRSRRGRRHRTSAPFACPLELLPCAPRARKDPCESAQHGSLPDLLPAGAENVPFFDTLRGRRLFPLVHDSSPPFPAHATLRGREAFLLHRPRSSLRKKLSRWCAAWMRRSSSLRALCSSSSSWALMGIEIPEPHGGAGGSFFDAVLAIEAISTVDPAVAVLVDVHNTLVINALRRWGTDASKQRWLPAPGSRHRRAPMRSARPAPAPTLSPCRRAPRRPEAGFALNGRKLWISNAREAGLFIVFATSIRRPAIAASRPFWSKRTRPASPSAAKKTSWVSAPRAPAS